MRINNNIMAMNTHRQYGINNTNVSSSVEKLSSGYRINRAGDDAAGLAISEKMRAQIRGLNMASKNSQDAISLVQTAEGALQTTHDILQRMREIATQSASDTNESTIDRSALNKEFQALLAEIDDTASKTAFNDQKLIDGTFASVKVDNAANTYSGGSAVAFADALTIGGTAGVSTSTLNFAWTAAVDAVDGDAATGTPGGTGASNITAATKSTAEGASANETYTITASYSTGKLTFSIANAGGTTSTVEVSDTDLTNVISGNAGDTFEVSFAGVGTYTFSFDSDILGTNDTAALLGASIAADISGSTVTFAGGVDPIAAKAASVTVTDGANNEYKLVAGQEKLQLASGVVVEFGEALAADFSNLDAIFGITSNNFATTGTASWTATATLEKGVEFVVQTGANKGDELAINIDKMDSKTLGVYASNVSSREYASNAIKETNDAINKVSSQRADLGALQNRLEFKISNLDTSAENLQSAESRIRDLDMAKEMTEFTKNNILSQAATAMLAQANSLPQGVLQLLG